MQWCKGVLPWKSRIFISAPNCIRSSSITRLPHWHARCNNEPPWRQFPGSLESLILWQPAGPLFSSFFTLWKSISEYCVLSTWWYESTPTTSSKVVLMIFASDVTIRRYTSCKFWVLTASQMLVVRDLASDVSLMTSNFSTYWARTTKKFWISGYN